MIDQRHRATGACKHVVGSTVHPAFAILAIGREADGSFLLFYCNNDWEVITDTWHATVEDAKKQARFEYEGIDASWIDCE